MVRDVIRTKNYSIRTEEAYVNWVRRFILFHDKRHPKDMGGPEIEAFLTHLAVEGHVSASTQNQALSALLFLYRTVLHQELNYPIDAVRAKPSQHLPEVLTKDEARQVISHMSGIYSGETRRRRLDESGLQPAPPKVGSLAAPPVSWKPVLGPALATSLARANAAYDG